MGKPEVVDTDFYFTQQAAADRQSTPGGVYLDDVLKEQAEVARAKAEGREPDLDNPSATAGTPIQQASQVVDSTPHVNAEPAQKLPVVVGEPELDDDGNPTGNKSYLVRTKSASKRPAKKSAAKKSVSRAKK